MPKHQHFSRLAKATTLLVSFACAANYFYHMDENPSLDALSHKVWSTGLLALYHHLNGGNLETTTALAAHTVGDLLIGLPGPSILYAIPAFLYGHLKYANSLRKTVTSLENVPYRNLAATLLLTIASAAVATFMMNNTSGLVHAALPVYITALTSVFIFATMQAKDAVKLSIAAFAYLLADLLIGLNEFELANVPFHFCSWPLYFGSQFYIATRPPQEEEPLIEIITGDLIEPQHASQMHA